MDSLIRNHPFVDGNKRTAITAGWSVSAPEWVCLAGGERRNGAFHPGLRTVTGAAERDAGMAARE